MKLPLSPNGGRVEIGSSGASFAAPTNIQRGHLPAPRAMAKIVPVMIPGIAREQHDPLNRLPLARTTGIRAPSRIEFGTASASSVATMTTGSVNRDRVSDAQIGGALPKVQFGSAAL